MYDKRDINHKPYDWEPTDFLAKGFGLGFLLVGAFGLFALIGGLIMYY